MITVRQIERLWNAREYGKLCVQLLAIRPEAPYRLEPRVKPALAAAMAVVRLAELCQSHVPLYGRLVREIVAAQESDGGWGEPAATALCVRALLCGRGGGTAIERGIQCLADLQQPDGTWTQRPAGRLPADPQASAFILHQLGDDPDFRRAVRIDDAVGWFDAHYDELDEPTVRLWTNARFRCRPRPLPAAASAPALLGCVA